MATAYKTATLKYKNHTIYYALYGNPKGIPVLVFHGGPGSKSKDYHVGKLDLNKFHIIMFDQPASGRSTPSGTITNNDTQTILDISLKLVQKLNIKEKLIIKGRSWGATLALLFAINYPTIVRALLLQSVFMATKQAAQFIFNNNPDSKANLFLPERYNYIKSFEQKYDITLQEAFEILTVPDKDFAVGEKRVKIATALFLRYIVPCSEFIPVYPDFTPESIDEKAIYGMRIFAYFDKHNYFLPYNYILNNINKIVNIKTFIGHSRYDLDCPFAYAYTLHKSLKDSTLFINHYSGHRGDIHTDLAEANWTNAILY